MPKKRRAKPRCSRTRSRAAYRGYLWCTDQLAVLVRAGETVERTRDLVFEVLRRDERIDETEPVLALHGDDFATSSSDIRVHLR